MNGETETVGLARDVEASVVPSGTRVTLQKGEAAVITQSLGGTFTVVVNGNMFRIDGVDADAFGRAVIDGDEDGSLALAGRHAGHVGSPHLIDPIRSDPAVMSARASR